MLGFILRRLLALIPLLLIISFIVFGMTLLVPGDPARTILGTNRRRNRPSTPCSTSSGSTADSCRSTGTGSPAFAGDLGYSWYHQTEHVRTQIAHRFPVTFSMAIGALAVTILLGVPMGLIAGTRAAVGCVTGA